MRHATAAAALVAALAACAVARADEGVAFATLENGTSIGFALLRTGAQGPAGAIGEAALPRSNTVSRVLFDRETRRLLRLPRRGRAARGPAAVPRRLPAARPHGAWSAS